MAIEIKVNGESREYRDELSLDELIDELNIRDKVMASAHSLIFNLSNYPFLLSPY